MELKQLKEIIDLLRREGVVYYKHGELELQIGPAPDAPLPLDAREAEEVPDTLKGVDPLYRHPALRLG